MENGRLRYAMIGGGPGAFIGRIHRMALAMNGTSELVAAVFTRNHEANVGMGSELGVARIYDSWQELIARESERVDRPDFISICVPNNLHFDIARTALRAGFSVMCEKPMTLRVEEAEELERLVAETRLKFGLMHSYTGAPMLKLAHDLVAKGHIGKVCKVVVEYQQGSFRKIDFTKPLDKRNSWKMDPSCAGASCCMGDIGVHAFNLIEYVTGLQTASVLADVSSFAPGNPLDDDGTVLLRFRGGAKGVIVASKIATGEENGLRMKIYGEKRSLVWEQERPDRLRELAQLEPERVWKRGNAYISALSPEAARSARVPAGHPEGFIEAIASHYVSFCAAVAGVSDPGYYPSVTEGVRGVRFVDSTVRSSAAGAVWCDL
jgi:predicted dehydrogenase